MIVDTEELLEEVEDDLEMLGQMFQIFEGDAEGRVARLRAAIEGGDANTVMEEAHALKGGVGNFFAMPVFETAYKLEAMGQSGDLADAAATFAELESQLGTMKSEIQALIAG